MYDLLTKHFNTGMLSQTVNNICLVQPDSHEWHYMWAELASRGTNRDLPDPTAAENFGEVWQYMETQERCSLWSGRLFFHCFRHRLHPVKGAEYRVRIPASRNFLPGEMQPSFFL